MLDKTASSTISVLPLHIAKTALELLIVGILRPGSHQITIRILLTQPPCVPVDQLLGTVARHPARETTSEIKIFLSNAWVSHRWVMLTSRINITTQEVHSTLLVGFRLLSQELLLLNTKSPKKSILARIFGLWQGFKDKSCPGQEIIETRTR